MPFIFSPALGEMVENFSIESAGVKLTEEELMQEGRVSTCPYRTKTENSAGSRRLFLSFADKIGNLFLLYQSGGNSFMVGNDLI